VYVSAYFDPCTVLYHDTTDEKGNFNITDVLSRGYLLNVTAGGYQSRLTVAYVVQGRTTYIPFILLMPDKEKPPR